MIRAQNVVNATGVWADRLRPEELHDAAEVRDHPAVARHARHVPARGPAAERRRDRPGRRRAVHLRAAVARRLAVGTTDTDYDATDLDHVKPADDDLEYLLDAVNAFFATELTTSDITGAFAGVRPLISTADAGKSVDISRKAELYETSSGMVTITGGKLTTWRRMAKMAVDRLVEREARDAPCRTHEIPLGQAIEADELPRVEGVARRAYAPLAAATATPPTTSWRSRPSAASSPAGRRRAARPAGRGRPRGAPRAGADASATRCCGGRGWG